MRPGGEYVGRPLQAAPQQNLGQLSWTGTSGDVPFVSGTYEQAIGDLDGANSPFEIPATIREIAAHVMRFIAIEHRAPRAIEALVWMAATDESANVRNDAIWALRRIFGRDVQAFRDFMSSRGEYSQVTQIVADALERNIAATKAAERSSRAQLATARIMPPQEQQQMWQRLFGGNESGGGSGGARYPTSFPDFFRFRLLGELFENRTTTYEISVPNSSLICQGVLSVLPLIADRIAISLIRYRAETEGREANTVELSLARIAVLLGVLGIQGIFAGSLGIALAAFFAQLPGFAVINHTIESEADDLGLPQNSMERTLFEVGAYALTGVAIAAIFRATGSLLVAGGSSILIIGGITLFAGVTLAANYYIGKAGNWVTGRFVSGIADTLVESRVIDGGSHQSVNEFVDRYLNGNFLQGARDVGAWLFNTTLELADCPISPYEMDSSLPLTGGVREEEIEAAMPAIEAMAGQEEELPLLTPEDCELLLNPEECARLFEQSM